jgi:hypothetical protein
MAVQQDEAGKVARCDRRRYARNRLGKERNHDRAARHKNLTASIPKMPRAEITTVNALSLTGFCKYL